VVPTNTEGERATASVVPVNSAERTCMVTGWRPPPPLRSWSPNSVSAGRSSNHMAISTARRGDDSASALPECCCQSLPCHWSNFAPTTDAKAAAAALSACERAMPESTSLAYIRPSKRMSCGAKALYRKSARPVRQRLVPCCATPTPSTRAHFDLKLVDVSPLYTATRTW